MDELNSEKKTGNSGTDDVENSTTGSGLSETQESKLPPDLPPELVKTVSELPPELRKILFL